ncbi:hypothetical protein [Undibacterium sp. Ji49W]
MIENYSVEHEYEGDDFVAKRIRIRIQASGKNSLSFDIDPY